MALVQACFVGLLAGRFEGRAASWDPAHTDFARVLSATVRDGWVDYATLQAKPEALNTYLDRVAAVTATEFAQWSEPDQLAFLFNLYNAATLKLIIDHYPISSIRKIGGIFESPWKRKEVRLWGETVSLDELEHQIVRRRYHEPRLHFALVCAAVSCPPLRSEPYVGARLDAQLDDQGRQFLRTPSKNRVDRDTSTLWLSPIFKWYSVDFGPNREAVIAFVRRFFPEAEQPALATGEWRVRYTDYDWSLNDRKLERQTK